MPRVASCARMRPFAEPMLHGLGPPDADFTGVPFPRGCQFHRGADFTGVPISWGCRFHGGANFTGDTDIPYTCSLI